MAHQEVVKDIYLKVIEATIAGAKAEFEESGGADEKLLGVLDTLRERWQSGLLESHDFTEDPAAFVKSTTARGTAANKASGTGSIASNHGPRTRQLQRSPLAADNVKAEPGIVASTNGGESGSRPAGFLAAADISLPNQGRDSSGLVGSPTAGGRDGQLPSDGYEPIPTASRLPGVPRRDGAIVGTLLGGISSAGTGGSAGGPPSGSVPQGDGSGGTSSGDGEPALKRARHDEEEVNANEDLGSDDSDDDQSDASDGECLNFIVAQHDSVKKGGGNGKWKVRLKDGILHLNGREYLFSKAACDLDW